jgi:HK97 gp10 family phage protein
MSASVKIEGLAEVDAMLAELTKTTARNVLDRVLMKRAQPMVAAAKAKAPRSPGGGRLAESIKAVKASSERKRAGDAAFGAAMRGGASKTEARAALIGAARALAQAGTFSEVIIGPDRRPYAHMIEFGTGPRVQKETGRFTGQVAPQPYLRPAFDETAGAVLDGIADDLRVEVTKSVNRRRARLAKKAAR